MLKIAWLCLLIAMTTPLLSQVQPSGSGGPLSLDDTRMMTPPPVKEGAYPGNVGADERSNFISGGLVVTGAYNDNVLPGTGPKKIGDWNFSILPTIAIDRKTPHQSVSLSYSAGFNLYAKETKLNGVTQTGSADARFNLTRYVVFDVRDSFYQNNNLFNQANPFNSGGISSGGASPTAVYVYPYQNMIGNSLSGGLEYQYGRNAMIGAGGNYSLQHYASDSATSPNLSDSDTYGGSAFWSRRISRGQYLGLIYEYSSITTHPVQTTTNTNTISGFYTRYLTSTISFSVTGGPQHFDSQDTASGVSAASWTPAVQASVGYQTLRTNFAVTYSRIVSGAGGLIGAYHSSVVGVQVQRQLTRAWTVGASGGYADFNNVTPTVSAANPGGHSIAGTAFVERTFQRVNLEVGYSNFYQTYANFGTASQVNPDANRVFAAVTYQFTRPLGR